MIDTYVQLIL